MATTTSAPSPASPRCAGRVISAQGGHAQGGHAQGGHAQGGHAQGGHDRVQEPARLSRQRSVAGGFGNPLRVPITMTSGACRLSRQRSVAGGFGNPFRVPITMTSGACRLSRQRSVAGGFGNPFRVPITMTSGACRLSRQRSVAGGFGNPLRVPIITSNFAVARLSVFSTGLRCPKIWSRQQWPVAMTPWRWQILADFTVHHGFSPPRERRGYVPSWGPRLCWPRSRRNPCCCWSKIGVATEICAGSSPA